MNIIKKFGFCFILLCVGCDTKLAEKSKASEVKKPNIIVILSDQERYPAHWPKDWAEQNLKANARLRKHGLSFNRAYTAACECTPSRAVIYSGNHYPINKVPTTPPKGEGLPSEKDLIDIGTLLKEHAGYDVVWKGKWHLSNPLNGGHDWTEKDIGNVQERYNIYGWNPPDAGTAITENIKQKDGTYYNGLKTLGGGWANNDGRFLQGVTEGATKQVPGFGESILDYINKISAVSPEKRQPFCMFISFVNPHDIWVYPTHWEAAGYKKADFENLGISFPDNYQDDLLTKPSVQKKAREAYEAVSPLKTTAEKNDYINFYAYLNKLVDSKVEAVLDALDRAGLAEDTIIIRTADHGELGLSHGMREKAYTVYEEMIHIPFIVSNPKLFPQAKETEAFYCHLDLLPTIADLAQVPDSAKYGKGTSIVPVLKDPTSSVQNSILFTYDDMFFLPEDVPGGHIRAVREGDWVYAVYYSENATNFEYEMYNIKKDPGELHNLLYGTVDAQDAVVARRLHALLKEKIDHSKALPAGFAWPKSPF
jgi:choline-sulfatase